MSKTTYLLPNGIGVTNNIAKFTTGNLSDYVDVVDGLVFVQQYLFDLQAQYNIEEYYEYKRIKLNVVYKEIPFFICKQPMPFMSINDLLVICAISKSQVRTHITQHIVDTLIPFVYHTQKAFQEAKWADEQAPLQMEIVPVTDSDNMTMSSLEIAELCEKQHKNVMVDIKSMLEQLEINSAEFSAQYKDSIGRTLPCFNLNKELSLTLVAGYNVKLRHKIIQRWQELEKQVAQPVLPVTPPQPQIQSTDQNTNVPLIPFNDILQQIEKMNLPESRKQIVIADLIGKVSGLPVDMMMPITYEEKLSPAQIAEKLGVTPQAVGRVITKLGLRGDSRYSEGRLSKSTAGNKEVTMFYYTSEAVKLIEQSLNKPTKT